ncbi:helix-turn-helix domain-containing protein [Corynebacterium casei]|uniref:helix-turn-helix domain-containing protein n=1 Tax=Corynebacterium casei TaxID=160386 RepID=UPI003F9804DB
MFESALKEPFRRALVIQLTQLRQQSGMSQTAIAAELGIDQSVVSRIEAGTRELGIEEVFAWGEALALRPEETSRLLAETWTTHAARRKGYWTS